MPKTNIEYFGSMEDGGKQSPYTRIKGVLTPIMKKTAPIKKTAPKKAKKSSSKMFNAKKFNAAKKSVFGM